MRKSITIRIILLVLSFCFSLGLFASQTDSKQKMNLDVPEIDRFQLSEQFWPVEIGDGHVCLWKNDKYAAATITIDDNIENDHKWWLDMQDKYDFNATWFIILRNVSEWNKYQNLIDSGNEIQGHDNCDINEFQADIYANELAVTKSKINEQLSNNSCTSYAYPCGDVSKLNEARKHYISIRGVVGLMNHANKINYLNLSSRSATNDPHDVDILLNKNEKLWGTSYQRGWFSTHYHSIAAIKDKTENFIAYLTSKSDSIWIGNYSDVAKYGQERDTHLLTTEKQSNSAIKITLSDEMKDEYYDVPLTVKIRIDNTWNSIQAKDKKDEMISDVKIIEHNGNKYALLNIVPDKGAVMLTGSSNNVPVLDKINDQNTKEGSSLYVPLQAKDKDEDQLYLELKNAPLFISLTESGDGLPTLRIAPLKGDSGSYKNIIVTVNDTKDTVSTSFSLIVEETTKNEQVAIQTDFLIYPQIVNRSNLLTLVIKGENVDSYTFDLLNINGSIVFEKRIEIKNGLNTSTITPPHLQGLYFARIYNQDFFASKKIFFRN